MQETRPKMHVWGANRVQKVIFRDEYAAYALKGWRDHPSKVGQPLEVIAVAPVETPVEVVEPEVRVKRAYNKRG